MEKFPWWTEEQKKLADEVEEFAESVRPVTDEMRWTKEIPWDVIREIGRRGYFGALIPKEYGGMGLGCTGGCIIHEGMTSAGLGVLYMASMCGGTHQIILNGTEEQKERWLPRIARGELAAICLTEPFVGSDTSGMETTARREGDEYVINGKKRFITNAGIAGIYLVYARTSDQPEDVAKHRHISAFIVEKGTPGFTVEKINELCGWDAVYNGYLSFNDVRVPAENMLGEENEGWRVLVSGLNFERTIGMAASCAVFRELLRYAVFHSQRRIQFGRPTIEYETNQYKIADMISWLKVSRLIAYYTAYLIDLGVSYEEIVMWPTIGKILTSEAGSKACADAIRVMGGDGFTRFYPVESLLRSHIVAEIGAGTNQILRRLLFRQGLTYLAEDIRPPRRRIHEKLGVPVLAGYRKPPSPGEAREKEIGEEEVLEALASDYRVNPGLYMTPDDLKDELGISDDQFDRTLESLENKGMVRLYRDKRGVITLAKATYKGLSRAKPPEYYRWFPEWVDKKNIF
ncbi:MAG: acyl-CoA dehydrogenase family protein [Candidatus Freyarchaeota archaeon]|nr:acyl-CoA dehydrogenase family protein [Deltaproteobacteria bacterium]